MLFTRQDQTVPPVRVLRPHIAGLSARPVLQLPTTGTSVAPLPRAARRGEGRAGGGCVGGWGDGTGFFLFLLLGRGRDERWRVNVYNLDASHYPGRLICFECISCTRVSSLGRTVVCAADVRGTPWRSASTTFRAPTWLAFTAMCAARKVRFLFLFLFFLLAAAAMEKRQSILHVSSTTTHTHDSASRAEAFDAARRRYPHLSSSCTFF